MPKHKAEPKNHDWLDSLIDEINEFADYCSKNLGLKIAKQKVKKAGSKTQDAAQELITSAHGLATSLREMAQDIVNNPSVEQKALREFKRKGEGLEHKVNHVLKHASKLEKEVKSSLVVLRDAIHGVFSTLGNIFKNIFTGSLSSSMPVFSPHHNKGKDQHLQNEQAFKSKQNMKNQPGIHRKILTTQKGGRRGG